MPDVVVRCQTFSSDARSCHPMPDIVIGCQTLTIDARHYHPMPDTIIRCQTLAIDARHCHPMPGFGIQCQTLSSDARRWHPMPDIVIRCQTLSSDARRCHPTPEVVLRCQTLSSDARRYPMPDAVIRCQTFVADDFCRPDLFFSAALSSHLQVSSPFPLRPKRPRPTGNLRSILGSSSSHSHFHQPRRGRKPVSRRQMVGQSNLYIWIQMASLILCHFPRIPGLYFLKISSLL